MHELWPVMLFQVPRAQGVWAVDPLVSTKYPALAFVHATCPVMLFQVPSPQGVCVADPLVST